MTRDDPTTWTDAQLKRRFTAEFDQLRAGAELTLTISPLELWVVVCELQLALRHPGNVGPTSRIARRVMARWAKLVVRTPALRETFRRGGLAKYDQPVADPGPSPKEPVA